MKTEPEASKEESVRKNMRLCKALKQSFKKTVFPHETRSAFINFFRRVELKKTFFKRSKMNELHFLHSEYSLDWPSCGASTRERIRLVS